MQGTRRDFLRAGLAGGVAMALERRGWGWQQEPVAESVIARDFLRPQFHLMPARNWINDPCGPIFFDGKYHLYNQYNPHAAVWGDMHWAHAVSTDMVHWEHMPVALAPTPGGADADGCFTGSAVVQDGVPTFVYTGVTKVSPAEATLSDGQSYLREVQCLATAADASLGTWKKLDKPVLPSPPPGMKVTGFRDPCPWKDGEWWYLGVGSGVPQKGGMVLLYRSRDLRQWEYLHPLREGEWSGKPGSNPVDTGEMWECPDFFPLGSKHVLFYSTQGKVLWEVGEYDKREMRFHPQKTGLLDAGAYYAPKSMLDAKGNRILWGWIPERRPEAEYAAAGWAGVVSLPRVLTVGADGNLEMRIAPEFESLRRPGAQAPGTGTKSGPRQFDDYRGEVLTTFSPGTKAGKLELQNAGQTLITIAVQGGGNGQVTVDGAPLENGTRGGDATEVRVVMDASVIEVIVNGRAALTKRVYNLNSADRKTTVVRSGDGASDSAKVNVWQVNRISDDRLTS